MGPTARLALVSFVLTGLLVAVWAAASGRESAMEETSRPESGSSPGRAGRTAREHDHDNGRERSREDRKPTHETEGNVELQRLSGFRYLTAVSGNADPNDPLPLVVAFHGVANRARPPSLPYFGVEEPFRVVRPQAPEPYGEGYSWLPFRFGSEDRLAFARALRARSAELAQFLEALRRRYPTRGQPILIGFSQGGTIAFGLAAYHPGEVAESIVLASWLPSPVFDALPVVEGRSAIIHIMHSRDDDIVSFDSARDAATALQRHGFRAELEAVEQAGHELSGPMSVTVRAWLTHAVRRQQRTGAL